MAGRNTKEIIIKILVMIVAQNYGLPQMANHYIVTIKANYTKKARRNYETK